MRRSVGYGAYDGFGDDIPKLGPKEDLYTGSTPIRVGRGSLEIKSQGGKEPGFKRYTFEAGMTPFGILLTLAGGGAFVYLIYKVTGKLFGL